MSGKLMLVKISKFAVALAAALSTSASPLVTTAAYAQNAENCACIINVPGEVAAANGRVLISTPAGRSNASIGAPLPDGSELITGASSTAVADFGTCQVALDPQQTLAVSRLDDGRLCAYIEGGRTAAAPIQGGIAGSSLVFFALGTALIGTAVILIVGNGDDPASP